jgi:hypothetical protein
MPVAAPRFAADSALSSAKIYVANLSDTITTYLLDGTETTPTIVTGSNSASLWGMTVGADGKIYALSSDPHNPASAKYVVTAYKPDGTRTTPTISLGSKGYGGPVGLAVDSKGKIYIVSSAQNGSPGIVRSYDPIWKADHADVQGRHRFIRDCGGRERQDLRRQRRPA